MKTQLTEALARRNLHNIKKVGKPPLWIYPRQYEVLYRAYIISLVNRLRQNVQALLEKVPTIIAQRDTEVHTDAWPDSLQSLLVALRYQFDQETNENGIKARLLDIGQKTSDWNDKQWQNTLLKVLGVDVYRPEHFLGSHIKSFVNENSLLIKKLTEETYGNVSTVLTRGIRSGDRVNTIRDALLTETDLGPGVFHKVETRARLIARDQVGKLNGELTRIRQESIGVSQYKWHTALDERVRGNPAGLYPNADPSHFDREGQTFDWDDPPEGGHPGEAIQCRCWAEAIFPEEIEEKVTEEEEEILPEDIAEVPSEKEEGVEYPELAIPEAVDEGILSTEKEVPPASTESVTPAEPFDEDSTLLEIAALHDLKNFIDYSEKFVSESEMLASKEYQLFDVATERWRSELTFAQKHIVEEYTDLFYRDVNAISRGETSRYADSAVDKLQSFGRQLERTLDNATNPMDIIVYRGSGLDHLVGNPESLKGKVLSQNMFLSTSLRRNKAEHFLANSSATRKALYKIRVPRGVKGTGYIDPISAFKGERELLINRTKKIIVESVTRSYSDRWVIEGTLLP